MIYNNHFNEYSGETSRDIIMAVYADSHKKTGIGFDDWWAYQQDVWKQHCSRIVPPHTEDGAYQALFETLIESGALVQGAKP